MSIYNKTMPVSCLLITPSSAHVGGQGVTLDTAVGRLFLASLTLVAASMAAERSLAGKGGGGESLPYARSGWHGTACA